MVSPPLKASIWTWALDINSRSIPCLLGSRSDKVQMNILVYSIVAFVLIEQTAELVHVQLVEGVEFLAGRLLLLLHLDRPANCREATRCRAACWEPVCSVAWGVQEGRVPSSITMLGYVDVCECLCSCQIWLMKCSLLKLVSKCCMYGNKLCLAIVVMPIQIHKHGWTDLKMWASIDIQYKSCCYSW